MRQQCSLLVNYFDHLLLLLLQRVAYTRDGFSDAGEDGRSDGVDKQLLLQQRVQQQRDAVRWTEVLQHLNVRRTAARQHSRI